ncbi:APC family permease [Gordonia sp. (in: high G+C Gram-positive bacteria)]|uniref:APC family permease n=1 Tax=unclassified Gordonia (in: high G+C Gram-positive bacteria) TaxID=2657482 RepID=UPI00261C23A1|nr:APC family permease [Gordonia sp. (in: high G+C Gram-positive bacteria)]
MTLTHDPAPASAASPAPDTRPESPPSAEITLAGRTLTSAEHTGLRRDALGSWGVFAQGLAAAAPSVALASVPISLYVAAGKGAAWAAVVGLVIALLLAATIGFQARRTVSSGSLGTYAGNGLGPAAAFAAGLALLLGYIGFATTGTLGGVLYVDSFLTEIGIGSETTWFKLLLATVVAVVAIYLPYRGASLAAKYELVFELVAVVSVFVIIVASYISYGFRIDTAQWSLSHLGNSSTFVAAVVGVGSYAGFESVASLGAEARDAHRTIARSLLRVVLLLGVLYILATYPQVLQFGSIDNDQAILPQLADSTGVPWIKPVVSLTVAVAFIVFVTAVTNSAARSLFTLSHEGALPKAFSRVHRRHGTPWVGVAFVGVLAIAFSWAATLSNAGRLIFDVYGGYVATWGFLISYLLVVIATPIWLYRIKALTPLRAVVSGAALLALGYVIVSNVVPTPEWPYNILPFVFLGLLALGLAWYTYLRFTRPEVARRIGSIQTLSIEEQERLADLGLLQEQKEQAPSAT